MVDSRSLVGLDTRRSTARSRSIDTIDIDDNRSSCIEHSLRSIPFYINSRSVFGTHLTLAAWSSIIIIGCSAGAHSSSSQESELSWFIIITSFPSMREWGMPRLVGSLQEKKKKKKFTKHDIGDLFCLGSCYHGDSVIKEDGHRYFMPPFIVSYVRCRCRSRVSLDNKRFFRLVGPLTRTQPHIRQAVVWAEGGMLYINLDLWMIYIPRILLSFTHV